MSKQIMVSLCAAAMISALIGITLVNYFTSSDLLTSRVIAHDVKQLEKIFTRIHNTCRILGFDHQKNIINFLNVKSFTGSEVGSMNLAYPDKWRGPYMDDNPTVQRQEYMIVQTDSGYFITPGEGVELPNGKVIGTDIKFDLDTDIMALMHDKEGLYYKGLPLAAPMIDLGIGIPPQLATLD
jgi:hypothetical protein